MNTILPINYLEKTALAVLGPFSPFVLDYELLFAMFRKSEPQFNHGDTENMKKLRLQGTYENLKSFF